MIISCPGCGARYDLGPAALPETGRAVRCTRCAHSWRAMPEAPPPMLPALRPAPGPPADMEPAPDPASAGDAPARAHLVDDGPHAALAQDDATTGFEPLMEVRARRAAHSARDTVRRAAGRPGNRLHAFALGVLLAVFAAALHYRADVVAAVPSAGGLYAMAGLPVNLRGLDFVHVAPRRAFEDGLAVLVVEGEVKNVRNVATAVPALRFSLRGGGRDEVYAWTVEPRTDTLEPGATMPFRTRLASPPAEAVEVEVRFTDRRGRTAGIGR